MKSKLPDFTNDELRLFLFYDPWNGNFTWIKSKRCGLVNKEAGCSHHNGYIYIKFNGKSYPTHNLAWYYMFGEWPLQDIDHKNTIKDDNRFENLRLATKSQNNSNKSKYKTNKSGYKGVSWYNPLNKWISQIQNTGKKHNLGYFDCPAAAYFIYIIAADKLHGEYAKY
jgi:hypothetical protein